MKFTKGPWIASAPYVKVNNSLGYILTLSDYDRATQVADSHLIAAAPIMYDTLEMIFNENQVDPEVKEMIERVLRKARGES